MLVPLRIFMNFIVRHQQQYVLPTVVLHWRQAQSFIIADLKSQNRGLVLAGDGRSDSPCNCAKYGAFTFIKTKINKVLDIQQVRVLSYVMLIYSFFIICFRLGDIILIF